MGTKNLYSTEAKEKIKELAESIDFAMLVTDLKSEPFHTVPMSTKEVDDDGNIWFLSNKTSTHNKNIEREKRAHLIYGDKGSFEFLSIYGRASIHSDRDRIKELYGSGDDAWFDGVGDPNITALKIEPDDAHYWDTKNGKVISLLKMVGGAISGNEPDLGEEGKLKV
ncbi:pyridoxamine 5'-phosphate oxidase family protein [Aequorivita capsosiphonis]|uniref:pyridoxamine 5'-phosphate oxidase family protein n=1 Tax=Aequorivita capsosiphonis TaxID=487317 RepID=UPI0003F7311F|nr:pyridoxamine 5'-phosphate oxidase family protein [Aequorivita capsosiphonis]